MNRSYTAFTLVGLLLSSSARADDIVIPPDESVHHIRGVRPEAHANFGGYGSLGAGFRLDIPLAPNGIVANADDEVALSPGADLFFRDVSTGSYDGGPYGIPSVALQWNFYVSPRWSVFPEAGFAIYVGERDGLRDGRTVYPAANLGVGARYYFNDMTALLIRASTPSGVQVGLAF